MDNGGNILQLCRLCLVKDDVNIPIFEEQGDIKQIFQKISACLPVKVTVEDKLPKKICDGCSYKLDMFYDFWNSTANAEKQLIAWLGEANANKLTDIAASAATQQIKSSETVVKQETIDPSDLNAEENDDKTYMFPQKFSEEEPGPSATATSVEEPPPKRARRTAAVKAQIAMDPETDEDDDSGEPMTKVEDESEDSDGDHDPSFVDVPSTSADDQPGPSGVGKDGSDAPSKKRKTKQIKKEIDPDYIGPKVISKESTDNLILPKEETPLSDIENLMKFSCEICDDKIESSIDFALHSIKHSSDGKYHCHHCSFKSKMIRRMKIHMNTHGNMGKYYQCESCFACFPESIQAVDHKNFHSGEMPFKCDSCEKHFMFSWLLSTHRRLFHWGGSTKIDLSSLTCSMCNILFRSQSGLRKHIYRKHSEPKEPTLCDICGRCFSRKESLKFHRRTHTGYKPHSCATCGKSFCKKELLVEHERVHTGEKPFVCSFCGKGFSQRTSLKIHMRLHTGERPYVCRFCGKGCICKSVLDSHMRNCSRILIE